MHNVRILLLDFSHVFNALGKKNILLFKIKREKDKEKCILMVDCYILYLLYAQFTNFPEFYKQIWMSVTSAPY